MANRWTTTNIPDMNGRLAVITGSNSGIGLEAAKALAAKGAHVVLAVRNTTKGQAAVLTIQREVRNAKAEVMQLNLADLASINRFTELFQHRFDRLDLLINNAGVMGPSYQKTKDGFELQFGTNHLGHFALTGRLLPNLFEASHGRIVTVSSAAHHGGRIDFGNLDGSKGYGRWKFYGQSKLANLLFAYELERRLEAAGREAISVACHPGFAATNLAAAGFGGNLPVFGKGIGGVLNLFAQSAQMGALPTLYAATEPTVPGGAYVGPLGGMRGYPGIVKSNERSHDKEVARKLWAVSEELTGVHYAL
ncbi:oxidoreductase [Alicyclobacillus dauci]|uniref:Oxidoreductase n=1 Tax=Alicyclobacillus dauci TaxID=1475485 RepID=A0ABY6Z3H7_9BACL|nr:oxidoreductase [Alicyclobacillus dauci]WAH37222.1 oxidoreductase [Alicyclobacillus dauci]